MPPRGKGRDCGPTRATARPSARLRKLIEHTDDYHKTIGNWLFKGVDRYKILINEDLGCLWLQLGTARLRQNMENIKVSV
ncbi:hypothetical protein SAMN05660649_02184 [Desulfotomaculum arcticum]|uniref:Uncharacterized protein n=1 Tax=Desulfotruncus arcticus DSM 17038 TaxID=1121424 RepID=A0A1I2TFI6_9FIRM|nr:hypothetical protein SAMN05660649_02184 [Desulfotomaculum arcticum] [Desulfotruncus arcticus DSM 17038]